jgi:hypothetical protein
MEMKQNPQKPMELEAWEWKRVVEIIRAARAVLDLGAPLFGKNGYSARRRRLESALAVWDMSASPDAREDGK